MSINAQQIDHSDKANLPIQDSSKIQAVSEQKDLLAREVLQLI